MDCIFCKIASGTIPCNNVYEDQYHIAFLDIRPISAGHTIIIPKKHVADIESLSYDDMSILSLVVKKIGKAMVDGLGVKGYSVFLDNKSAANQHVPHVHFHVVPRAEGDGLDRWPQQNRYAEGEAETCERKIREGLEVDVKI